VKRIVDDAREDGIDFFYAAPNPNGPGRAEGGGL
jgi:hypothetical protein